MGSEIGEGRVHQGDGCRGAKICIKIAAFRQSILDDCLFDQKHRDIVANGINPTANAAFQIIGVFVVCQWLLADRTREDFE